MTDVVAIESKIVAWEVGGAEKVPEPLPPEHKVFTFRQFAEAKADPAHLEILTRYAELYAAYLLSPNTVEIKPTCHECNSANVSVSGRCVTCLDCGASYCE